MTACLVCGSDGMVAYSTKGAWTYRRCESCGLLTLDPIPTAEQIEAHYRTNFERGNYALALRYMPFYRRVYEQVAGWIAPRPGERLLDVGTFTGVLLEILAARGADVYGVELQEEAVAIANERLGGRVFRTDLHGAGFPSGPYDIVSMIGLIEHVVEPREMVRRAHELLRPAGRLYLQTPDAGSAIARAMRSAWPPLAPIEHVNLFSARSLRTLLGQEGFVDVRIRRHVKLLPFSFVHAQLASFGGPRWQRVTAPLNRILGDTRLPFYGGEIFVSAVRR